MTRSPLKRQTQAGARPLRVGSRPRGECYASGMIRWRRKNYLVSFHPLCSTLHGRTASTKYGIPKFIDGSCRREPDLQQVFPSISALCRAGKFAPRLRRGDRVFYMTVKGTYGRDVGRAMVAALEVMQVFPSHTRAARWYRKVLRTVPSNCMVRGNAPIPVSHTTGLPKNTDESWKLWSKSQKGPPTLAGWDRGYQERARQFPSFIATRPLKRPSITSPRIVSDQVLCTALRTAKVPGTQTYKLLSDAAFGALTRLL
jgi:hypothetical protein